MNDSPRSTNPLRIISGMGSKRESGSMECVCSQENESVHSGDEAMITVFPPMYAEGYAPTMGDDLIWLISQEAKPGLTRLHNLQKGRERFQREREKA